MAGGSPRIVIVLPPGSGTAAAGRVEDVLLDGLDEVLGDVAGTGTEGDRGTVTVDVRDLKSGVIALRRLLAGAAGPGTELRLTGDGVGRTILLAGNEL